MGKGEHLASLQLTQQKPRFDSPRLGEGRSLHLPVKPNKGLVPGAHISNLMSNLTSEQAGPMRIVTAAQQATGPKAWVR